MFASKILPKIHLLCVLALVKSQNYEYSADEGGTDGEVQGEIIPDYSKYFSVSPKDESSSLAEFAQPETPINFESYDAAFDASNQQKKKLKTNQDFTPLESSEPSKGFTDFFAKNIFPGNQPKDYFEQAQSRKPEERQEESSAENKEQNRKDEEKSKYNRRGPNYISHDIPTKIPHQVETVKVTEKQRVNNYNFVNPSSENYKQKNYNNPLKHATEHKYLPHLQPAISQQHTQLYPRASGVQNLPLQISPSATPYQKYSFQPVAKFQNKYSENLNSATNDNPTSSKLTTASTQSQETKSQPKTADRKNCIKMKRNSGDKNIADLTCYVCENKETNSKVTECSYQSEPDSTDLLRGSSQRYSVPANPSIGFRYKRAASDDDSDPYEYVKSRSLNAQNEKEKDDEDLYSFEGYGESQPEKSYSEIQSEEILKDPKKCTDVQRDGMSCRVCKDPTSGGNFESCSYTSAPKPDKYAYVSEKNYDSNDEPQNASEGETKNVPVNAKASSSSQQKSTKNNKLTRKGNKNGKEINDGLNKNVQGSESKQHDHTYTVQSAEETGKKQLPSKGEKYEYSSPSDYAAESTQESENVENENENQEESAENSELSEDESPYGEYKFKYFPEFSVKNSEDDEQLDYQASSRKEVEDVLADFKKRDRSQCQQTKKNGMTCFLCVGENKVKNEECMFISESKPTATIAKYTINDGIVSTKKEPAELKEAVEAGESKKKDVVAAPSSAIETRVRAPLQESDEPRVSASAPDSQRIEENDDDPKLETPAEFQTTDEGGAYSAETKPVYSKVLGMTLPQYMLEKSEFEKEFDASSKHF